MKFLRPIVSVFLASLVLIASIGVTVNLHLCAGQVQSFAFFGKAQPCKDVQKPCHGTEHHAKKQGCCEEQNIVLKGKETTAVLKAATEINPSFQFISDIHPVLYSAIDLHSFVATPGHVQYKPPLIKRDITILVQSFLI